jgi:hypothetical protein
MTKEKWVWMPHPGHFICAYRCQFHLNTYVGKYIVSTVGEMPYLNEEMKAITMKFRPNANKTFEEIGSERLYETMVFKARKDSKNKCCPYDAIVSEEVDFAGYNTAEEAYKGHMKLCAKWSKEPAPPISPKEAKEEVKVKYATWTLVRDPLYIVECPHCHHDIFMSSPSFIERMKRWARNLF